MEQLKAIWMLKRPSLGNSTELHRAVSVSDQLGEMPWGKERLVAFQSLSTKLSSIASPDVYFPTHNDAENFVRLIGIRGKYVKGFKDLDWPDGFIDPQPVAWTHLTFAAIRQNALPGGHKDGNRFGCWVIDPSAFDVRDIEVDKLIEQGLLSYSESRTMFRVHQVQTGLDKVKPNSFRFYFDTSKTDQWCKNHYGDDYITAFSTGVPTKPVGKGLDARFSSAQFLFLKRDAGFRVECHRSVPNAIVQFTVNSKVSDLAPGSLNLPNLLVPAGGKGDGIGVKPTPDETKKIDALKAALDGVSAIQE
jgi:hypothetical protein